MLFNFSVFNHCLAGQRCIEDLTAIISAQMEELGHETRATDDADFTRDGYNVLYESFADPGTLDAIAAAHEKGYRFLYVATEEPTQDGCFNGRLDNAMDARQAVFPEACRFADGILHLAPGQHATRWYSQFAPAAYAELGCARSLLARNDVTEPEYDFGFYGQMTPRRRGYFDKFQAMGYTVLELPFIEHNRRSRDEMMRRCRVIPQIRAHDSQGIISSSRCATALSLGRPVVAEPHEFPGAWADVVSFSTSIPRFFDLAIEALNDWRRLHVQQLAQFIARLTPEVCIGTPLREIGL